MISSSNSFAKLDQGKGVPLKTSHVIIAVAILLGAYFSGPVVSYPQMDYLHSISVPERIEDLEGWINNQEAQFNNIKKDNEKKIVWANPSKLKTPWSVVYVHGFSASRLETAPLAEMVAEKLKANVFYTRLTGHGLEDKDRLGEATPNDWVDDYRQALEVGERLGEKVLVISCSTGSTIALLSSEFKGTTSAPSPQAHVFISPNLGPKDKRAEIILAPWGERMADWIEGPVHHTSSSQTDDSQGWYKDYPTKSLFPMMHLVKLARDSHLENFTSPLLVLYSERDQVVDVGEIKKAFNAIGSNTKQLTRIDYSDSENQHVLAGRIKAPKALAPLSQEITTWLTSLESAQGFR